MADKRQEWVEKIDALKKERDVSGAVHAKDLSRQIHRMEKELKYYDLVYKRRG